MISTALNYTNFYIVGGACRNYVLYATNACGTTQCLVADSCTGGNCSKCQSGTNSTSYTVTFANQALHDECDCDHDDVVGRCAEFDGSFTVTGSGCEWTGGPFGGQLICGTFPHQYVRRPWRIYLKVQQGDCAGMNLANVYAILGISYTVTDPSDCADMQLYQKLLGTNVSQVDCDATIPGTYTPCGLTPVSWLCDVDVSLA
jgi:hypothetical protein